MYNILLKLAFIKSITDTSSRQIQILKNIEIPKLKTDYSNFSGTSDSTCKYMLANGFWEDFSIHEVETDEYQNKPIFNHNAFRKDQRIIKLQDYYRPDSVFNFYYTGSFH